MCKWNVHFSHLPKMFICFRHFCILYIWNLVSVRIESKILECDTDAIKWFGLLWKCAICNLMICGIRFEFTLWARINDWIIFDSVCVCVFVCANAWWWDDGCSFWLPGPTNRNGQQLDKALLFNCQNKWLCGGDRERVKRTEWNTMNYRRPKWQTSRIVKLQIANILSFNGIKHMDAVRIIWNANHFIWLDPVMSIWYTNTEYTKKHITWMHTAYSRMNW